MEDCVLMQSKYNDKILKKSEVKIPQIQVYNCYNKKSHQTENDAKKFAKMINDGYGFEQRVYKCDVCGCYHLSSRLVK
jgi:S-ribosylhomocysteine lyase LuxS involved in autoinducer biosynthesis